MKMTSSRPQLDERLRPTHAPYPRTSPSANAVVEVFRPLSERPENYRAGRSDTRTLRTCSNGDSNRPGCPLTIRLTHSGRAASRIFWKMTAPLRPLNESPATPTAGPQNSDRRGWNNMIIICYSVDDLNVRLDEASPRIFAVSRKRLLPRMPGSKHLPIHRPMRAQKCTQLANRSFTITRASGSEMP
jgi:hypothetical protein